MALLSYVQLIPIGHHAGLSAKQATSLAHYKQLLVEQRGTGGGLIGVPLTVNEWSPFISPVHMRTSPMSGNNVLKMLRQACFTCRTALAPCSCKCLSHTVTQQGGAAWHFKCKTADASEPFQRFLEECEVEQLFYRWEPEGNNGEVTYILLPQCVLGFLQAFPDVTKTWGKSLGHRFGWSTFYVSSEAPPPLAIMEKLYTFVQNLRDAYGSSRESKKHFDEYAASSLNVQNYLLELTGLLRTPEDGELAILRENLRPGKRCVEEGGPDSDDERQPSNLKKGRRGQPSALDRVRPLAQFSGDLATAGLAVLTSPASFCRRGQSSPGFLISSRQASVMPIWRKTPTMPVLVQALTSVTGARSKVLRLRLRGRVVENPRTLLAEEEARSWLLGRIDELKLVSVIGRWCCKQLHKRLGRRQVQNICRALWLNLSADTPLPPELQTLLPDGVLPECVTQICAEAESGAWVGFQRSPMVSSQMAGPITRDACHPETETIGLPVISANLFGADYDGDTSTLRVPESEFTEAQFRDQASYSLLRWDATGSPNLGLPGWAKHAVATLLSGGHRAVCMADILGGGDMYWHGGRELRLGRVLVEQALGTSGHGHAWLGAALPPSDVREVKLRCPPEAPALSADGWFPIPAFDCSETEDAYVFAYLRSRGWSPELLQRTSVSSRRWSRSLNMPSATTLIQYALLSVPENDPMANQAPPPPARQAADIVDHSDEEESGSDDEGCDLPSTAAAGAPPGLSADIAEEVKPRMVKMPRLPDHPDGVLRETPMYHSCDPAKSLSVPQRDWLRMSTALGDLFYMRTGSYHVTCVTCGNADEVELGDCPSCKRCCHIPCRDCGKADEAKPGEPASCRRCPGRRMEERGRPRPYRRLHLCWAAKEEMKDFEKHELASAIVAAAIRRCLWRPSVEECRILCALALREPEVMECLRSVNPNITLWLEAENFMAHMAPLAAHFEAVGTPRSLLAADALHRFSQGNAVLGTAEPATGPEALLRHYRLSRLGCFGLDDDDNEVRFRKFDLAKTLEMPHSSESAETRMNTVIGQVIARLIVPSAEPKPKPMPMWARRVRSPVLALARWQRLSETYCRGEGNRWSRHAENCWRRVIRAACYRRPLRLSASVVADCCETQLSPEAAAASDMAFFQVGSALSMVFGSGIGCNDIVPLDDTPLEMLSEACNSVLNARRAQAINCRDLDYKTDVRLCLLQHIEQIIRIGSRAHLFGHDIGALVALTASYAELEVPRDQVKLQLSDSQSLILTVEPKAAEEPYRTYLDNDKRYTLLALPESLTQPQPPPRISDVTGTLPPAIWYLFDQTFGTFERIGAAAPWMPPSSTRCRAGPDSRQSACLAKLRSSGGKLRHRHLHDVFEPPMLFATERDAGVNAKPDAQSFTVAPTVGTRLLDRATRECGLLGNEVSDRSLVNLDSRARTEASALKALVGAQKQKDGVSLIGQLRKAATRATNAVRLGDGRLQLTPYVDGICRRPVDTAKPRGEICGERLQRLAQSGWFCRKCGFVQEPPAVSLRLSESGHALGLARNVRRLWDWRRQPCTQPLRLLRGNTVGELNNHFADVDTVEKVHTRLPFGYEVSDVTEVARACRADLEVYSQHPNAVLGCPCRGGLKLLCDVVGDQKGAGRSWWLGPREAILVRQMMYPRPNEERPHIPDVVRDTTLQKMVRRLPRTGDAMGSFEEALGALEMEAARMRAEGEDDNEGDARADLLSAEEEDAESQGGATARFMGEASVPVIGDDEDVEHCEEDDTCKEHDEAIAFMLEAMMGTDDGPHSYGDHSGQTLVYAPEAPCPDFTYTLGGFPPAPPLQAVYYGDPGACTCDCGKPSHSRLLANATPFRRPSLLRGADTRKSLTQLCDDCIAKLQDEEAKGEKAFAARLVRLEAEGAEGAGVVTLHSADPQFHLQFYTVYAALRTRGVPLRLLPVPQEGAQPAPRDYTSEVGFANIAAKNAELRKCCEHLTLILDGEAMPPWKLATMVEGIRRGEPVPKPTSVMSDHYALPLMRDIFQATGPPISLRSINGPGHAAPRRALGIPALLAAVTCSEPHQLVDNRGHALWGSGTRKRVRGDRAVKDMILPKRRALGPSGPGDSEDDEEAAAAETDSDHSDCFIMEEAEDEDDTEGESHGGEGDGGWSPM